MHFNPVFPIFQFIIHPVGWAWKFSCLPDRDKSFAQANCQGSADDESSGFDSYHQIDFLVSVVFSEPFDHFIQRLSVTEEGGDVTKEDSRFREIRDRPYFLFEVHH